jgi:hypothetical protein
LEENSPIDSRIARLNRLAALKLSEDGTADIPVRSNVNSQAGILHPTLEQLLPFPE